MIAEFASSKRLFLILSFAIGLSVVGSCNERTIKAQPRIYLSFVKVGTLHGESCVWVRINNLSPWNIEFAGYEVPKERGDFGVSIVLACPPPCGTLKGCDAWTGPDVYRMYTVQSRHNAVISFPLQMLKRGTAVRVEFRFGWEQQDDAEHWLLISDSSIPRDAPSGAVSLNPN